MLTRKVKLTKDGITMELPFSMESEIQRFKSLGYYEAGEQPLNISKNDMDKINKLNEDLTNDLNTKNEELLQLKAENQKLTKQLQEYKKKQL